MPPDKPTPNSGAGSEPSPQEISLLIALYKQGRHAEAEALAGEMTVRFPRHGFGWKAMGTVLLQQGRAQEAVAPFQKALELSRGDPLLHNSLGNAFAKLGRLHEAEASYWQALMLDPNSAEARHNLDNILRLGRISEAERLSLGILQRQPGQADADPGRFSDYLFIVGAQKAGTTSLYSYFDQRPELVGGELKEKSYFSTDSFFEQGDKYYRSLFPIGSRFARGIDATPEYLYYGKCASRIHAFAPDAKIVVLLREPVSRALSAFNMYHQLVRNQYFRDRIREDNTYSQDFFMPIIEGRVEPTLRYFLDRELEIMSHGGMEEEPSLIRRGLYAPQLERYIRLFGREDVLILFSNDLKSDTHNTVNKVCDFIGLKPFGDREYPMKYVLEYTVDKGGKKLISQLASDLFARDKLELASTYGLDVPW
ncbi:MAG: tetratricopeptide repeat protein [Gallionella sp.]